jgi:hypothetical protein
MELIKMRALQSFIGSEGLIKANQEFNVQTEARASDLEKNNLAERVNGEHTPDEIPTLGPDETQTIGPTNTQTITPQQQPTNGPDEARANFEAMTLPELKERAEAEKIKGYKSMSKGTLVDTLITTLQSKGEL